MTDSNTTRQTFSMIDVGDKEVTLRRAFAQGTIRMSGDAFTAIRERSNPKGDVLAIAEVAAIQGAKRTAELLPLCHPLSLDAVRVRFDLDEANSSVTVHCEARTSAKTGVEMEALCGVNAGLLCIYDLSKAVDPVLTISDVRLNRKEGGKSGVWIHPGPEGLAKESNAVPVPTSVNSSVNSSVTSSATDQSWDGLRVGVLTVSDRCSLGQAEDRSGDFLRASLKALNPEVFSAVVPDEIARIREEAIRLRETADVLIVTGGTGLSPRDVTPEAFESLWTRKIPGIGEQLRAAGLAQTPMAVLSRSEAGMVGKTFVVLLPGSQRAVEQGFQLLKEWIPHIRHIAAGGGH